MCLNQGLFRSIVGRTGLPKTGENVANTSTAEFPEDTQVDGSDRRYWRRRRKETAGDYWDSRRNRDRARERQPAPEDDLRIPQPDINDPNPTPSGGINY